MSFNTNEFFQPGKLTTVLDGGAGSSGKGKIASFLGEHSDNWQFCCNAFMSNAAHWVELDDGTRHLYQCLNSVTHIKKYQKSYICGGAVVKFESLLSEIKQHGLTPSILGIHPLVAIVQDKDVAYERGTADFDGKPFKTMIQSDCMKLSSTLHGVGAARARRILRRSDVLVAKDIPELLPFICWTDREILARLESGQSGLLEIAQGFQLGYLSQFYPKTTSRNCSVAAGLDDCCLPPYVVGDVIVNFRTYPIRVNSNKFVHADTNKMLTSGDMESLQASGQGDKIKVFKGDSGACYTDQDELTWDQVTADSGIKAIDPTKEIREIASLTELERRVYSFSAQNMLDALRFNRGNGRVLCSINFMNYVDATMDGVRGGSEKLTDRAIEWLDKNMYGPIEKIIADHTSWTGVKFVGTGPKTDDMLVL